MTAEELEFLKTQIDEVVLIETVAGDRDLAKVLVVFDEGETPDVFYLKVTAGANGRWLEQESGGRSVLLSEIQRVLPVPEEMRPH